MNKKEISGPSTKTDHKQMKNSEGYPLYPPGEDIYKRSREVKEIDPEDVLENGELIPNPETEEDEIKELGEDVMGSDLDVPGADLDDEQEDIGNEDEENNYYSIRGDINLDLEEDEEE